MTFQSKAIRSGHGLVNLPWSNGTVVSNPNCWTSTLMTLLLLERVSLVASASRKLPKSLGPRNETNGPNTTTPTLLKRDESAGQAHASKLQAHLREPGVVFTSGWSNSGREIMTRIGHKIFEIPGQMLNEAAAYDAIVLSLATHRGHHGIVFHLAPFSAFRRSPI